MKAQLTFIASLVAASMTASSSQKTIKYSLSDLLSRKAAWIEVAKNIQIKKFEFHDAKWQDILNYIQLESKRGDSKGIGVEIFVPKEFEAQFKEMSQSTWSIQLANNLDIMTIFIESPPPDWYFYPIGPRRVAVIPMESIAIDINTEN